MAFVTRIGFPQQLVLRVLQGEREAQFEFYASVRLYILRICHSQYDLPRADVEDICQNISVSLHRNLARIEGDVGPWVNAAINKQLAKRGKRTAERSLRTPGPGVSPLPIESAIGIWEAMERLNGFCKRLIIAQIIQGCSKAETAKTAGIPYGSVSYRRRECLAELFQHYRGGEQCNNPAIPSQKSSS